MLPSSPETVRAPGFSAGFSRKYNIEYRTQARRALTFAIGGTATLPARVGYKSVAVDDPTYVADTAAFGRGEGIYNTRCVVCHGGGAAAAGTAPDQRTSGAIVSPETSAAIVHDGALVPNGMPRFEELTTGDRNDLRQYLRGMARNLAAASTPATASPAAR